MKKSLTPLTPVRALAAAAVLAATLVAPLVQAQTSAAGPAAVHDHGAARLDRTLASVGVSAATRTSIEAILAQARSDVKALRTAAGNPRQQLAQALAAANVDATAASTARANVIALQDSVSQRMLQAELQVAALLTPAQRQQLLALRQQHQAKWQGQRG